MNIIAKYSTLLLITFSTLFVSKAQNAKSDFKKINDVFATKSYISLILTYNLYENHTTDKVFKSETGFVKKYRNNQLYKLAGMEILSTDKFHLAINTTSKTIVIKKNLS